MPRKKLITNVVKKPWVFALQFEDGRTEEVEVQAESFSAAVLSLPRFAEVGRYKYTVLHGKVG